MAWTVRKNDAAQARVSEWCNGFVRLYHSLPGEGHSSFYRRYQHEITGLYGDGTVTAKCTEGQYGGYSGYRRPDNNDDTEHQLLASIAGPIPHAFCTCEQFSKTNSCDHIKDFIGWFVDKIDDPRTTEHRWVTNEKWSSGSPDPSVFPTEERDIVLSVLKTLPQPEEVEEQRVDLPEHNPEDPTRILWNVEFEGRELTITPVLQKKKKRGNGWTKGRRMSLEKFREQVDSLSPVDIKIRDTMEMAENYDGYGKHWEIPTGATLEALIGSPNVLINGEPGEVVEFAPMLCLVEENDTLRLKLEGSGEGGMLYLTYVGIGRLQQNLRTFEFGSMPAETVRAIDKLLEFPPVPVKFQEDYLQRLSEIADTLPIKLPAGMIGETVADNCTSVMLMRSNPDGTLDYGFRVRSQSGDLHLPGKGRFNRMIERDGKKLLLQRDFAAELKTATNLASTLSLPGAKLQGTLDNFEFSMDLLEQIESPELDLEVLWDKQTSAPMRMLGSLTPNNVSVGITQRRDWFQLEGECKLENETLKLSELIAELGDGSPEIRGDFVRVGSKGWARISSKLRRQLTALRDSVVTERKKMRFDATSAPAIRQLIEQDFQLKASRAWNQCLKRLDAAEKLEPEPSKELNAEMRGYQLEGYAWLRRLAEWGVGGILADDMGLGKTLQTLAVLLDRVDKGPCLVIAPTSVGFNWMREAEKFTPTLDAHLYRDSDREQLIDQLESGELGQGQIIVCSYGLALRDIETLKKVSWGTLVLDEAQAIKNSRSKTSLAIAELTADWKVALTGTPVENHLGELWSLFHVVSPGVFGGWEQFRNRFAAPIEKNGDADRQNALSNRLKPFVLRRTKKAVLTDLPPRTESTITVELSKAERKMYDKVRLSVLGEMDQLAKLDDVKDQRFRVLALLTRMRQLACSPKLVDETWTERSSKLEELNKLVGSLKEEGHRVLVFSQFVKHLELIREMFDEEDVSYEYLDGQTPAAERQKCVDRFQNGDATAFLISLKAGGTGLNLTAADYVVHMDPWWNPAVEDQATDRAHRIGQDKPVMVYRMISQHTIEDEIVKLHATKRDLVEGVMTGTQAAGKLSTQDLINLVKDS